MPGYLLSFLVLVRICAGENLEVKEAVEQRRVFTYLQSRSQKTTGGLRINRNDKWTSDTLGSKNPIGAFSYMGLAKCHRSQQLPLYTGVA